MPPGHEDFGRTAGELEILRAEPLEWDTDRTRAFETADCGFTKTVVVPPPPNVIHSRGRGILVSLWSIGDGRSEVAGYYTISHESDRHEVSPIDHRHPNLPFMETLSSARIWSFCSADNFGNVMIELAIDICVSDNCNPNRAQSLPSSDKPHRRIESHIPSSDKTRR
jgi:hypothetical protein